MFSLFKDRKVGKGKKNYLAELSKIAKEEREKILREKIKEIVFEEIANSEIQKKIDDFSEQIKKLEKMIEDLKSSLLPLSRSKSDSIRKLKMKRLIIEHLRKHGRLTSKQLSAFLDLSRTRCSEYLVEMERDGIVRGMIISRNKFYELVTNGKVFENKK